MWIWKSWEAKFFSEDISVYLEGLISHTYTVLEVFALMEFYVVDWLLR